MTPRKRASIPEPIAQLQLQLDQFRSTQPPRTKLPESLWQAAVELARQTRCVSGGAPANAVFPRSRILPDGLRPTVWACVKRRLEAHRAGPRCPAVALRQPIFGQLSDCATDP